MRKRLFNYVVSRLRDPQLTQEEFNRLVQMWNAVDSVSFDIMFHGYSNMIEREKYQKWSQEIMNSYYGENGIGVSNGN